MAKKPATAKPKAAPKPKDDAPANAIPGLVNASGNAIRQESSIHGG